jgi:hypothetical protein
VTELDKIFFGNKPCQLWLKAQRFRGHDVIPLMMETEMVSETLGFYSQLTRLDALEDFIDSFLFFAARSCQCLNSSMSVAVASLCCSM